MSHFGVGAIQMRAIQGGHADGAIVLEQDACDQGVVPDGQTIGVRGLGG